MLTSLMTREIERNKCTHSDGMSVLWIGVPLPWGGYKSEIAWTRSGTLVLGARPQGRAQARGRFSLVTLLQRAHPHVSSESFDVLGFVFAIMLWILASRSPHIRRYARGEPSHAHSLTLQTTDIDDRDPRPHTMPK